MFGGGRAEWRDLGLAARVVGDTGWLCWPKRGAVYVCRARRLWKRPVGILFRVRRRLHDARFGHGSSDRGIAIRNSRLGYEDVFGCHYLRCLADMQPSISKSRKYPQTHGDAMLTLVTTTDLVLHPCLSMSRM